MQRGFRGERGRAPGLPRASVIHPALQGPAQLPPAPRSVLGLGPPSSSSLATSPLCRVAAAAHLGSGCGSENGGGRPIILTEIKEKGKDTARASGQTGKTALKTRWSDPSSLGLPSPAQGGVCSSECEQLSQKARPRDRGPRAQDPQLPTPRQCFPGQEQLSPQLQPPKRAPHCPRVQCHVPAFPALTSNTHWAPTPHGLLPGASVHSDGAG